MLLIIDPSVLDADLALDNDACHGITEIFAAVHRGEHYALGSRDTLANLATCGSLSLATRRTISTVLANLPTLGSISTQILTRIRVTHGKVKIRRRSGENEWEVSLCEVGVIGVRKAVLITENLDDAKAYEHAAKQYLVSKRMQGHVALERAGGGGSTTPSCLENHALNEGRWCLCITDSDRICPTDNMDVTAKKCSDITTRDLVIAQHFDLQAREVENVIPMTFIAESIPDTHRDAWDWHIGKLLEIRPDAHFYCDIKDGVTLRKVYSYPKNSPKRSYWEGIAGDLIRSAAIDSGCAKDGNCSKEAGSHCQCYVTRGFGGKLLEGVLTFLDGRTVHKSEEMTRRDENRQQWMNIGQFVFEWSCAPRKTRL